MAERRLELDGLSKRFGEVVALQDMTFDVRPGEVFGFVGSNGAGKTTTMRIALGVLAADAGQVRYGGEPLTRETRRQVGYMPEERGLYPRMAVGAQLQYLARLHGMSEAQARASVDVWTERLGVAVRRGDEVQQLSLGNQQRVQLAAALVHDPTVLVLDEPFSGLDPVAVDVMSQVLREKATAGVPVLFSSHQLDLVQRLCSRVGIVKDGRIVAVGTVDELRAQGPEQLVIEVAAPGPTAGSTAGSTVGSTVRSPAGSGVDWTADLPGVRVVERTPERDGARTVLELAAGIDDQAVLHAALRAGPVRTFARRRASLAQLFRDVVSAPEEAA